MPGSGKSSVGRCLAARLGLRFLDSDDLIEAGEGRALGRILGDAGLSGFCRIEARYVRSISLEQAPMVIATGGSVIYSESAMAHLKSAGVVVFPRPGYRRTRKAAGGSGRQGGGDRRGAKPGGSVRRAAASLLETCGGCFLLRDPRPRKMPQPRLPSAWKGRA